jgi:diacylglycerol kinase family enzyme
MRALLVVNPSATTTSPRTRDVLVRALGTEIKLEVAQTDHRGHAFELGRRAAHEGMDVVVTLGGDGTVNEVVNGLLTADPMTRGASDLPHLAVVPGGSTNVFARAVGLPRDPVEATGAILDALHDGTRRTIGLSRAGDRWFTTSAGVGLDAEVVHAVDQRRGDRGIRHSGRLYVGTALRRFLRDTDRSTPALTLSRVGVESIGGLFLVLVGNSSPWTYLRAHKVNPTPAASFDTGMDVFGLTRLTLPRTLNHVRQFFATSGRPPHGRHVVALHDQSAFSLSSSRPIAFQVDGEYVGEIVALDFTSIPNALTVVA